MLDVRDDQSDHSDNLRDVDQHNDQRNYRYADHIENPKDHTT